MDEKQIELWGRGIESELAFWDHWFTTTGDKWPDEFARRLNPNRPLASSLAKLLEGIDLSTSRILDVGSGPISCNGTTLGGAKLNMICCDPLADYYRRILEKHQIALNNAPIKAFAEDLDSFFPREHFDLVTCTNALDHSFDPLRGIIQMIDVVKEGRFVVLKHMFNEAENESYNGLHQWNFDIQNDRFVIWNANFRIDVADEVAPFATVALEGGDWMAATITKTAPVPASKFTDTRARVRYLLDATMSIAYGSARRDAERAASMRHELSIGKRNERIAAQKLGHALTETRNLKREARLLERRATRSEQRLDDMLHSASWRITAPLRSVSEFLRNAKKKFF